MITLLNHLTKGTKVYLYKTDFKDSIYHYHQLKAIRELELKNVADAKRHWFELQKISPLKYGDDFNFKGEKELFSIALQRQLDSLKTTNKSQLDLGELDQIRKINSKLEYIFSQSDHYISKDELIYLLWREDWSPSNDKRLRTLIYRIRKKADFEINVKDGKYKKAS